MTGFGLKVIVGDNSHHELELTNQTKIPEVWFIRDDTEIISNSARCCSNIMSICDGHFEGLNGFHILPIKVPVTISIMLNLTGRILGRTWVLARVTKARVFKMCCVKLIGPGRLAQGHDKRFA